MRNIEALAESIEATQEVEPVDTTAILTNIQEKMLEMYAMMEQLVPAQIEPEETEETEEKEEVEDEVEEVEDETEEEDSE